MPASFLGEPMVIQEHHDAYPIGRRCWLCGNRLRGPIAAWPVRPEGGDTRAALICAECCKSAARRAVSDLNQITDIKEIERMGFDQAAKERRGWGTTLFVPDNISNH